MNAYDSFADAYDALNTEIDYDVIADRICTEFDRGGVENGALVLDLGCGTGTLTRILAERGYDMIGIDASEQMLSCARENECEGILYLEQDITEFELYGTVAAIISTTDTLNHITDEDDLRHVFSLAHNYLDPNGLFLSDLNSPRKFETVYSSRDYVLEDDGILLAWQNEYDSDSALASFYLTLFEQMQDGSWERSDTEFEERCYGVEQICDMLAAAGFEVVSIEDGYTSRSADTDSMRLLFVAQKVG